MKNYNSTALLLLITISLVPASALTMENETPNTTQGTTAIPIPVRNFPENQVISAPNSVFYERFKSYNIKQDSLPDFKQGKERESFPGQARNAAKAGVLQGVMDISSQLVVTLITTITLKAIETAFNQSSSESNRTSEEKTKLEREALLIREVHNGMVAYCAQCKNLEEEEKCAQLHEQYGSMLKKFSNNVNKHIGADDK